MYSFDSIVEKLKQFFKPDPPLTITPPTTSEINLDYSSGLKVNQVYFPEPSTDLKQRVKRYNKLFKSYNYNLKREMLFK